MTRNTRKVLSLFTFVALIIGLAACYFLFYLQPEDRAALKSQSGDGWNGESYTSFKSLGLTKANKFLISTSDQRASKIGADILKKGGNAIDAIIAAQMVLNVVEPQSSGIGGGAFLLYYDAKSKKTQYFNGRETAPIEANSEIFLDENKEPKDFYDAVKGGLSVGTPGLLKMLKVVHDKHGKLPWEELFSGAIKIAQEGFVMDEKIHVIADDLEHLKEFDSFSKIYLKKNGKAKDIGVNIKNPDMAETLSLIASEGIKVFYEGKIADDIVNKVRNTEINPGYLSQQDFKDYKVIEGKLVCGPYHDFKVCSMPIPSSGGITLLQILGILENFDLGDYAPSSIEAVHLISEASKLAYADRNKYIGDVKNVPVDKMLSKDYLKSRGGLMDVDKVLIDVAAGPLGDLGYLINNNVLENPSTTHLSVVDKMGNAISMTSSVEYLFGSALVVDGFILNNQLTDFSFAPTIDGVDVANKLVPGKQPRSSMAPTFVFDKNDDLVLIIGSPGGPRIIQHVLKIIIAHLDWNMNVAKAIALPNFIALNNKIELERGTVLEEIESGLVELGHEVEIRTITSGVNAINIDPKGGNLVGGADFRRNGAAVGE